MEHKWPNFEFFLLFSAQNTYISSKFTKIFPCLGRDLDADLPDVVEGRVEAAYGQVVGGHEVRERLGRGEKHGVGDVVDACRDDSQGRPGEDVGVVSLARLELTAETCGIFGPMEQWHQ